MAKRYRTFLCGGDETPGPRAECPNHLHDYPLPSGYVDASEVAARRLRKQWRNVRCPSCGLYGWIPPVGATDQPILPKEPTDAP